MDHRSIKRPRSESVSATEATKDPGKKKKKVKGNKTKDAAEKKKDGTSSSTTGTSDLPLLEMYVRSLVRSHSNSGLPKLYLPTYLPFVSEYL